MLIRKPTDIPASEITDETVYRNRRQFMGQLAAAGAFLAGWSGASARAAEGKPLPPFTQSPLSTSESTTRYEDATGYCNFYELGAGKRDPSENAASLITTPWSVTVDGLAGKPGRYDLEAILKPHPLEERIYRLRCVEAWSMVIPWVGFPLADLLKRFEPQASARFVSFTTIHDPARLPGQMGHPILDWPYVEALRLDEAMHPLTLMVVGMYGRVLPNQNGAPLRLMVPWKYGFKSIKSIVRITFHEQRPRTTWNSHAPDEYGFYANVNPHVDHPRWSQAQERRIGAFFKQDTLMYNGYGAEVAGLYAGMDLKREF